MEIEDLKRSSYWSEPEGRRAIELWSASGLTLLEFAARTGLRRQRLEYWRKRVSSSSPAAAATALALAPVTVLPRISPSAITVELRSGRAVRLEGDFADDLLERVIPCAVFRRARRGARSRHRPRPPGRRGWRPAYSLVHPR